MVADAVSSRTQTDRQLALERMQRIGAFANTTESVALSLVGDAAHPKFKVKSSVARWQNLIPSFPWNAPGGREEGAIQGKEGIKFCSVA